MEDWAQGFPTSVWKMPISSTSDSPNWQLCTVYSEHNYCPIYSRCKNMYKILDIPKLFIHMQKCETKSMCCVFLVPHRDVGSLQELTLFLKPRQSNNQVRPCHPSPKNYARLPPVQSVLRPEVVRFQIYLGRHRCAGLNPIHTFTATTQVSLTPTHMSK